MDTYSRNTINRTARLVRAAVGISLLWTPFALLAESNEVGKKEDQKTIMIVRLNPVRDTTIYSDRGEDGAVLNHSNGSGGELFAGNNGRGDSRRTLLAFKFDQFIPHDAEIQNVELTVTMIGGNTIENELTLHRLKSDWGEGKAATESREGKKDGSGDKGESGEESGGGGGAPARTRDATWEHRLFPKEKWENEGADFEREPSASCVAKESGVYTFRSVRLESDIGYWLAHSERNHGWILIGSKNWPSTAKVFGSRENPKAKTRPALAIAFRGIRKK